MAWKRSKNNPPWDGKGLLDLGFWLMEWRKSEKNPIWDGGSFLEMGFWGCDYWSWSGDPKKSNIHKRSKNPTWDTGGFLDLDFSLMEWRRSRKIHLGMEGSFVELGFLLMTWKRSKIIQLGTLGVSWTWVFPSWSGGDLRKIQFGTMGVSWSWVFGVHDFHSCHGGDLRKIQFGTVGVSWTWDFGVVVVGHGGEPKKIQFGDNRGLLDLDFSLMEWRRSEKNPIWDNGSFLELGFWGCDFCSRKKSNLEMAGVSWTWVFPSWSGGDLRKIQFGTMGVFWIWDFGVVISAHGGDLEKNPILGWQEVF
nr:uncharacterized protein LOC106630405 [Zonotrichia albicollis]